MTLEEKNFTMVHLLRKSDLNSKIIDIHFTKEGGLAPLFVKFRNNWAKEFEKRYTFQTSGRKVKKFVTPLKSHSDHALLLLDENVTLRHIFNWVASDIRKHIHGADKELLAFEFFSMLTESSQKIGKPRMATRDEDIHLGVDVYVPVLKKGSFVDVKIDIKSNPKNQIETARKNLFNGRDVSTLCFKTREDLARNKTLIEGKIKAHAFRGEIFNLDLVTKRKFSPRKNKRRGSKKSWR